MHGTKLKSIIVIVRNNIAICNQFYAVGTIYFDLVVDKGNEKADFEKVVTSMFSNMATYKQFIMCGQHYLCVYTNLLHVS